MTAYSMEHIGIAADDPEALAVWYRDVLGFSEFFRTDAQPPVIFLQDGSGAKVEIFPRKTGEKKPAFEDRGAMHLAIAVADFDKAVADLESRGARFLDVAKPIFAEGKARFFSDPEGNRLHIVYRPTMPW